MRLLIAVLIIVFAQGCKKIKPCDDNQHIDAIIIKEQCPNTDQVIVYSESDWWNISFVGLMPIKKLPKEFRPEGGDTVRVVIGWERLYPICLQGPCVTCENIAINCIEAR